MSILYVIAFGALCIAAIWFGREEPTKRKRYVGDGGEGLLWFDGDSHHSGGDDGGHGGDGGGGH